MSLLISENILKISCLPVSSTEIMKPLAKFTYNNFNRFDIPKWRNKYPKGRVCLDKSVLFKDISDCSTWDTFPYTTTVIINNCDKNFIYYNLNTNTFPSLERLVTNSNPCDFGVMHRFATKDNYVGYIHSVQYYKYLGSWWYKTTRHVKEITDEDYNDFLNDFTIINPTFD